jgi:ATP-dependent helicase/nuclease subunit A
LQATLAASFDLDDAARLRDILLTGSVTEIKFGDMLAAVIRASNVDQRLAALRELFFTKAGGERALKITKGTTKAHPALADELAAAQARFVALDTHMRAFDLLATTRALIVLADAVMTRYSHAKAQRATLDFDDLIRKTQSLLLPAPGTTTPAEWVLFKLDGGLDHILVDEAQDTSREQWAIVEALAAEFFAGGSRDDIVRTLFAVGDEKQSIYGFQGAAPEMFAAKGQAFAAEAQAAGRPWRRVPLNVSFRTTAPVLAAVDHIFADAARTPGLTAGGDIIKHIAHRAGQAGLVEIWPIERPEEAAAVDAWAPLDEATVASPVTRLAGKIADTIKHWLENNAMLTSENRPIRAGDVLVLVGRRQPFAPAMVAALKARKVPVGGADRLTLTSEIGVLDLLVLGDFLALPEDDLALATVLKSPLFGLDDEALTVIAAGRKKTLWTQLLDAAKTDARFAEAASYLLKWRSEADFLPPYEFFASVLERDNGRFRTRLLQRLGAEAADAIDELLNLALSYDEQEPPSLQGFLTWLRAATHEIKRDMDQGRDEVRVMTVHGAKGLEAPIVFLPDTCASGKGSGGTLLKAANANVPSAIDDLRFWPVKGTGDLEAVLAAKRVEADRDAHERNRLLYVALTRPRDRLYIAGYAKAKDPAPDCWYHLVRGALEPHMQVVETSAEHSILRLQTGQADPHDKPRSHGGVAVAALTLPDWATRRAPREGQLTVPLAPSRLAPLDSDETGEPIERPASKHAEPAALPPGISLDTRRFLRGTLTHALFEHLPSLPSAIWDTAAAGFLDTRGAELPVSTRKGIAREALAVLRHEKFAALFGPDSQAEVPIVAEIARPDGRGPPLRLTGQIDRLARVGNDVLIIDYKTNRPPPLEDSGVAEAYLLQLAAYRIAMRQIFQGCTITCAIVWTDGCRLMEISSARLDAAEGRLWQLEAVKP